MAPVASLFARPLHPYTRGLLQCLPHPSRFGQPSPPSRACLPISDRRARLPLRPALLLCRRRLSRARAWARRSGSRALRGLPGGGVMAGPLLEVQQLEKQFAVGGAWLARHRRIIRAVDGVSFALEPGETLGLVGESGCGKSTTGRLILRLIEPSAGHIRFEGAIWWRSPASGAVGGAAADADRLPGSLRLSESAHACGQHHRRAAADLRARPTPRVAAGAPRSSWRWSASIQAFAERYPHELSGGQRQRIGIAAGARPAAEPHRGRRAGVGARRVHPGPGAEPAHGSAAAIRPDLSVHLARSPAWCCTCRIAWP